MKTRELYLRDALSEAINRPILPIEDEYSRFDAYDMNDNIYELKVRGGYYENVLIEFDKFSYNIMYAETFEYTFLYVVQMEGMGYVFDISALYNEGHNFGWENRSMPKQTEFSSTHSIYKVIGYVNIEDTIFAFKI